MNGWSDLKSASIEGSDAYTVELFDTRRQAERYRKDMPVPDEYRVVGQRVKSMEEIY